MSGRAEQQRETVEGHEACERRSRVALHAGRQALVNRCAAERIHYRQQGADREQHGVDEVTDHASTRSAKDRSCTGRGTCHAPHCEGQHPPHFEGTAAAPGYIYYQLDHVNLYCWQYQARSNRSSFITLCHAATKSCTNFAFASELA